MTLTTKDSTPPKTLKEAKARGLSRYFTGAPCRRGHYSERNLDGQCMMCRPRIRKKNRLNSTGTPEQKQQETRRIDKLIGTKNRRKRALSDYRNGRDFKAWREKYFFDASEANRIIRFFENRLVHIEGELRGQPFLLEIWQKKLLRTAFGWRRRDDGCRKFRVLYLEIPRKNGKSALCSGIGLYLMYGDKEPGSKVVSAAASEDQARQVFDVAKDMITLSPKLSMRLKVFKGTVVHYATASNYKVVSAEGRTKHGKNLHGIVIDEVHAQEDRELYDVLHTSTGSRRQPMEVLITTAGFDKNSICWELREQAVAVLEGDSSDESFLGVVYCAEQDDDWKDEAVWYKANPNLGVSKKLGYMRQECDRAKAVPGYENTFKRLDLNIWTEQDSRWLPMDKWDACNASPKTLAALKGRKCYGGLDLASTQDIAAFVLAFPLVVKGVKKVFLLPYFFCPKEAVAKRTNQDKKQYAEWVKQGYMEETEGNTIDYAVLRKRINEAAELFDLQEVQYDRWNASQLVNELTQDGISMIPVTQSIATLTAPSKSLETRVVNRTLMHGGHKVLRWMAKNVATIQNADGEIRPSKKKSKEKIDGIVASIMAIDRLDRNSEGSQYDNRGLAAV